MIPPYRFVFVHDLPATSTNIFPILPSKNEKVLHAIDVTVPQLLVHTMTELHQPCSLYGYLLLWKCITEIC